MITNGNINNFPIQLFAGFKISQNEFFKVHLNRYNVIFLDIQWMYGNAIEEMKRVRNLEIIGPRQKLMNL